MRLTRFLLLLVAAAAIAGVTVSKASALAYDDNSCPFMSGTLIKLCPTAEVGKAYSYRIQGRNGTGCVPYVKFKATGALPPGISLGSDGTFSGTPTQAGEWTFWVAMQDIPASEGGISWCADSKSTEEQFRLVVVQGLQIQQRQSQLAPGQLNTPYNLQLTVSGASSATWSVSAGSLPPGLSLNSSTGALTGTPTATGDWTFKVTATSGGLSDSQSYALSVVEPLTVTTPATVGEVGIALNFAPKATGGKQGYTFALNGTLPDGLTFDSATGAISGTPTATGPSTVDLTVTDSIGLTKTVTLRFTIVQRLLVTKTKLKDAVVGTKYSFRLRSTGGARPYSWRLLGGRPGLLPRGLKLNLRTGVIYGTPTVAGTYRLRFQATDGLGAHAAVGLVLKVKPKVKPKA